MFSVPEKILLDKETQHPLSQARICCNSKPECKYLYPRAQLSMPRNLSQPIRGELHNWESHIQQTSYVYTVCEPIGGGV